VINFEQTNQSGSKLLSLAIIKRTNMSIYCFVLRSRAGGVESLGCLPLPDDSEAVTFGEAVMRESAEGSSAPYAGAVMEVTDGARTVGRIQTSNYEL
jgi:hypothetical protein